MSWTVTVTVESPEPVVTAAVMVDATGIAEVADPAGRTTVIAGFETEGEAIQFAAEFPGAVVEPVDESNWHTTDHSTVDHPTGPIELEVGSAFGHGDHPTTKLALEAVGQLGDGDSRTFLDVGCGTGVLSIAAARQGFIVSGCDVDPDAIAIAVRNADRNGVGARVSFVCASPTQLATPAWLMRSTGFDAIVVNTLVGVHEAEGAAISALANDAAPILVTGIQGETQLARTQDAYEGRVVDQRTDLDPWVLARLTIR